MDDRPEGYRSLGGRRIVGKRSSDSQDTVLGFSRIDGSQASDRFDGSGSSDFQGADVLGVSRSSGLQGADVLGGKWSDSPRGFRGLQPRRSMAGILLAGGRSSRMGTQKALLPFGGTTMLERIANEMQAICGSVTVAAADERQAEAYRRLGLMTTLDAEPGCGPLAALHAALSRTREETAWVSACDMPLASRHAAAWMSMRLEASGAMAAVPEIEGRRHPLQAVYRTECGGIAAMLVAAGERRMQALLERIRPVVVTEKEFARAGLDVRFAENVNTPEEYERLTEKTAMAGRGEEADERDENLSDRRV